MYTPPLSVPSLGAKLQKPTTPGPQRRRRVYESTTIVVDIPLPSSTLTSEALDKLWTHWDRSA
jgi:hypothetical protein